MTTYKELRLTLKTGSGGISTRNASTSERISVMDDESTQDNFTPSFHYLADVAAYDCTALAKLASAQSQYHKVIDQLRFDLATTQIALTTAHQVATEVAESDY